MPVIPVPLSTDNFCIPATTQWSLAPFLRAVEITIQGKLYDSLNDLHSRATFVHRDSP
ncbi:hypothetical protein DPMN_061535, partial [Dreissena polymorpha]